MLKKNETIENINNSMDLINKYAENLNTLELKYKLLQQENNDLLQNLEINKQIIKNFFKNTPFDKKFKEVLSKIQEENKLLYEKIEKLSNENKRLIVTSSKTNIYKNQLEVAKGKIFIFENILKQKENIIKDLKIKKYIKRKENEKEEKILKETIYVTSPKCALNKINDTLYTFKEINQRLTNHIRTLKDTLVRKNLQIQKKLVNYINVKMK